MYGERKHRREREGDAGQPDLDEDRSTGNGQRDVDRGAREISDECTGAPGLAWPSYAV